jgi:hypothetical protein
MLHSCLTRWKRSRRKGSYGDQNRNYEYEQESDADAFQNKGARNERKEKIHAEPHLYIAILKET